MRTSGTQTVLSVPFLLFGSLSAMQCNILRGFRNKWAGQRLPRDEAGVDL
jgi:hypothetical protein